MPVSQSANNTSELLPISAIILTNSSDSRFLKSLQSVQFCQQVIIGDNHSGNDWTKLAEKYHFSVEKISQPITNFSQVRNKLSQKAEYDWVLFLDSDERLARPQRARDKIKQAITRPGSKHTAYQFLRSDFFQGRQLRFGEAGRHRVTRLFNKHHFAYTRPVHEEVVGLAKGRRVKNLNINIIHYAHPSLNQFIESVAAYAELEAEHRSTSINQTVWLKFKIISQMVFFPILKFGLNYGINFGFLDGRAGLTYASVMSLHSLLVRVFWWEKLFSQPLAAVNN